MSDSRRQMSKFAAIFAAGTLLSRVLGLVRNVVWVHFIPSASLDAFLVAFKLPNMLRDLVGEGAMNAAFVPVFSETLQRKSEAEFRQLVAATMTVMALLLAALTVLGIFVMPTLLQVNQLRGLTGGRDHSPEYISFLVSTGRWTFPYIFFIGLTVFMMGPLFTMRHYTTPSWSPALLNVAIIACCALAWKRFPNPAHALVLGVWLGGIAQLVIQYVALGRYCGVWMPSIHLRQSGIKTMFALMVPVVLGQAAGEVNKLVDTLFAISLQEGVQTALFHANQLVLLPLSTFGIATSVAILPAASRAGARHDDAEIRSTLLHGFQQSYFLVLPAMLGLILLRLPITQLLYEHGEFSPTITDWTANALALYASGLLAFAWVKVAVTGFYAVQDTKTPVLVASGSMLLNILLNCALVRPCGYWGLALATTVSYTVNFALLYILLCNRYGPLWSKEFLSTLLRITLAGVMMTAIAYAVYVRVHYFYPTKALLAQVLSVSAPILAATASYAFLTWVLNVEELRHFFALLRRTRS
ncbi:MAG: murein biosynthesis integral membrane protein MurJ [Candidatus Hydrogenedentes bacterium]|nr:murein biosynthesis integral membrane protein MurJ [Candidatus Hydrogenedentota bacterium]